MKTVRLWESIIGMLTHFVSGTTHVFLRLKNGLLRQRLEACREVFLIGEMRLFPRKIEPAKV